jgi:hypothetical protein
MENKIRNEALFDNWLLDNRLVLMSDFIERKVWDEWKNYLEEEFSRWFGDKNKGFQPVHQHNQEQSDEGAESLHSAACNFKSVERGLKMKFDNEPLEEEILDRLANHQVLLSNNCPPMNNEKALVLLGEAMLNEFVEKFTKLWKDELFPHCLLRDHEASKEEVHRWIHGE